MENKKPDPKTEEKINKTLELVREYMKETQDLATKFEDRFKENGINSTMMMNSLVSAHTSVVGSLMAGAMLATMKEEGMESLNTDQLFAFLGEYQEKFLFLSQEVFFKHLETKAGLDMKAVNAAIRNMALAHAFQGAGSSGKGGNDDTGGMLPC